MSQKGTNKSMFKSHKTAIVFVVDTSSDYRTPAPSALDEENCRPHKSEQIRCFAPLAEGLDDKY